MATLIRKSAPSVKRLTITHQRYTHRHTTRSKRRTVYHGRLKCGHELRVYDVFACPPSASVNAIAQCYRSLISHVIDQHMVLYSSESRLYAARSCDNFYHAISAGVRVGADAKFTVKTSEIRLRNYANNILKSAKFRRINTENKPIMHRG